jgi:hypothetical protein
VDANPVAEPVSWSFAAGVVRGDDEGFMSGSVQMLKHS